MTNMSRDVLHTLSSTSIEKCMSCGRCSASCPVADEMNIMPHQFVALLKRREVEKLMESNTLWKCLSCFACIERCPRGVEPAKIVEASRLAVIRQQGESHISADEIPKYLESESDLPQQLLVSAFRKYRG
ncbi:MAG: 4Fe-4S dicluster domain-containing protein [Defluviitaleaceae bacterium]|nr:4Fe-4S dicluster domain-containing protein [Defluviitaleaceae bacterium]